MNSPLSIIGAELREAREAQQRSIDDLSHATLIHSRHLIALEEGRTQDLPEPFYVKNFIRKYANALGLVGDEFATRYWDTRPLPPPAQVEPSGPDIGVSWWIFPIVVGALVLGVLATLLLVNVRHSHQAAIGSPAGPGVGASASTIGAGPIAATASLSSGVQFAASASGSVQPPAASSSKGTPVAAWTAGASPAVTAAASGVLPPLVIEDPRVVFKVKTTGSSWMQIRSDGKAVFSRTLPANTVHSWTASHSLSVRIGNPGQVSAWVGNRALGKLGDRTAAVFQRSFMTRAAPGGALPARLGGSDQEVEPSAPPARSNAHSVKKPVAASPKPRAIRHPRPAPLARPTEDTPRESEPSPSAAPAGAESKSPAPDTASGSAQ